MAWDGVRSARADHEASLFGLANVVGVAVGRKIVRGRETDEPCIVVYVARKLPASALRRGDVVPRDVDGVRTDVVETGRFEALLLLQRPTTSRTARVRPAPGGVSVGHVRVSAGTLGVIARRAGSGPVILSNNHVLANTNDARPGDLTVQPAPADGGTERDGIARLVDFVPIAFAEGNPSAFGRWVERTLKPLLVHFGLGLTRLPSGRTNLVDAAIAEPLEPDLVSPEILDIGQVSGTVVADLGIPVRKSGRTSGLTAGTITGLDAVVQVDYNGRIAVFRHQLVSNMLSKGGDSGSLVVDDRERAVGLLFAGSAVNTLINPIAEVQRLLRLEF